MKTVIENKKDFTIGFLLCLGLVLASLGVSMSYDTTYRTTSLTDNVFIVIEKPSGISYLTSHNVITDIGENRTGEFHNSNTTSANGVLWISIGNATAGTGLTQLSTQYGSRYLGTVQNWTYSGDFAYNITKKITFTETQNINCTGAHWESTGDNNLYSVANFAGGAQTFNLNDNLTITWVYRFDCN